MMIQILSAVVCALVLMLVLAFMVNGAIEVASGGFLRLTIGSLLLSLLTSIVLSSAANILLIVLRDALGSSLLGTFFKCVLAAFAQPTITGIAFLSILFLLAMSAAKIVGMVEDIQILVDSHKAFRERSKVIRQEAK